MSRLNNQNLRMCLSAIAERKALATAEGPTPMGARICFQDRPAIEKRLKGELVRRLVRHSSKSDGVSWSKGVSEGGTRPHGLLLVSLLQVAI